MTSPGRGGLWALRTLVVAGVTLALAAGAHSAGGGQLPGAGALSLLLGALVLPTALLTRRRLRLPILLGWLGVLETLLHHTLGLAAVPTEAMPGLSTGHHHEGPVLALASAGADATVTSSGAMTLAHALATVLTALALGRAEAVLWALWEAVRPALVPLPDVRSPALPPPPNWSAAALVPFSVVVGTSPRGPPLRADRAAFAH